MRLKLASVVAATQLVLACRTHPHSDMNHGIALTERLAEWDLDPFVMEYYVGGDAQGQIDLNVLTQDLNFDLRTDETEDSFVFKVGDVLDDFVAVTFAQIQQGILILGGFSTRDETGGLAQVEFTPSGVKRAQLLHHEGPRFAIAASLDGFLDGNRVAILDTALDMVFVFSRDLSSLKEIAIARRSPAVESARHLHVLPSGVEGSPGTLIWITEVDEPGLNVAALVGRNACLVDLDGDGVFENIE